MSIRALAGALASILGFALSAGPSRGDSGQLITIRATSSLPDTVIEYVARSSEPASAEIKGGETPENFIRARCGAYTNTFEKVFYELNPELVRTAKPYARSVQMPACLRWRRDATVTVLPTDTIESLVNRNTGRSSTEPLGCPKADANPRCNRTIFELVQQLNPGINLNPLSADKLILPVVTLPTTIKFKPGLEASAVHVEIARLVAQAARESSIIENLVFRPLWLIEPVAIEDAMAQDPACKEASRVAKEPWPYDAKQVAAVLRDTLAISKRRKNQRYQITVTVLDTGLDAKTFPRDFLRFDHSPAGGGRIGRGVMREDLVAPFKNYVHSAHGTYIAEIVTGGSGLRNEFPELWELIRINVVNLVEQHGSTYQFSPSGLDIGVAYAVVNGDVANISVISESNLPNFLTTIWGKPLILVVAAGNDHKRLGDIKRYPANYGGMNRNSGHQVITVIAHDGNSKRAEFTNWGPYADLAAPGCSIPYSSNPKAERLHGTSVATPLVSLTVALLRAFDVKPHEIKNRLRASADLDPALDGIVHWNSRLNIVKALSLYHDVLKTSKEPGLVFGRWEVDETVVALCKGAQEVAVGRFKKFSALAGSSEIAVLTADTEGNLSSHNCKPAGNGIVFVTNDGTRMDVPWSEFIDLVPRYFLEGDDITFATLPNGRRVSASGKSGFARVFRAQRRM